MSIEMSNDVLREIANYYAGKLQDFGASPQGVDWNGFESQELRFDQLAKLIGDAKNFSVSDIGCGYGAFYDYLKDRYQDFVFNGLDVSAEMVAAARKRFGEGPEFLIASEPAHEHDFCVASGIFNVRLRETDANWLGYIKGVLKTMDRFSKRGFAFNCLTKYSDADKMQDYLYYADPCLLFDLCKSEYSQDVALLHDYGLYEFTLIVRKHVP